MRLLNTSTLELKEFFDADIPKYAILSHTWVPNEEVSFQDMQGPQDAIQSRTGYLKIKSMCTLAFEKGFEFVWIDTCSIDKTSSSELGEAINSMFKWYQKASVCCVFLQDVDRKSVSDDNAVPQFDLRQFAASRWFTRGWTLQELLAPRVVRFYDRKWQYLGSRKDLADHISLCTGIHKSALISDSGFRPIFTSLCVAERMSWAANRQTSRLEDMSYCLFGLFNVNLPLLYGEGENAFRRLQEEIMRVNTDQSILAWTLADNISHFRSTHNQILGTRLFAPRVQNFAQGANLTRLPARCFGVTTSFTISNRGLNLRLPVISNSEGTFIIIGCRFKNDIRGPIGLSLIKLGVEDGIINRTQRPQVFDLESYSFTREIQSLCLISSWYNSISSQPDVHDLCLVRMSESTRTHFTHNNSTRLHYSKRLDHGQDSKVMTLSLNRGRVNRYVTVVLEGRHKQLLVRVYLRIHLPGHESAHSVCDIRAVPGWRNSDELVTALALGEVADMQSNSVECVLQDDGLIISLETNVVGRMGEEILQVDISTRYLNAMKHASRNFHDPLAI